MNVFDAARQLGKALLDTPEGRSLEGARFLLDANEASKKMLRNYYDYTGWLREKIKSGELSEEDYPKEIEKLERMKQELNEDEFVGAMLKAEADFLNIKQQAMDIFNAVVQGDVDGGCSGDCGGCNGCH